MLLENDNWSREDQRLWLEFLDEQKASKADYWRGHSDGYDKGLKIGLAAHENGMTGLFR